MKALKGSAEEKALIERYVRELNEQEDRVQVLRKASFSRACGAEDPPSSKTGRP